MEWIKSHRPEIGYIELFRFEIIKMIKSCKDRQCLQRIHCLITNGFIFILDDDAKHENGNMLKIKTAMIASFGECGDSNGSLSVFRSMSDCNRSLAVAVTMTALMNSNESKEALQIYQDVNEHDVSLHVNNLAIKACIDCGDFLLGQSIIDQQRLLSVIEDQEVGEHHLNVIRLKTTLISFYGHFKEIAVSMRIFESQRVRDSVMINAMIQALCDNECVDGAHRLFKDYKMRANRETFVVLLSGMSHSESDGINDLVNLWENEMVDIHSEHKLDSVVMTAFIDGLSRKGWVYTAYQYVADCSLQELQDVNIRDNTWVGPGLSESGF